MGLSLPRAREGRDCSERFHVRVVSERSQSFSTEREIFAEKQRNLAKRRANADRLKYLASATMCKPAKKSAKTLS
jgi:hypothetical protein